MKAICWNVNSVNSRLERTIALLARHQPDVLCLQELKCTEDKFPFEAFKAVGYDSYIYGQKTYNGVALLSKHPVTDLRLGFDDGVMDEDRRLISGTIQGVRFICGYIPNGKAVGHERYYYKLNWLARLRRHLDTFYRKDDNLVVVGDFNIAPDDRDVHDPSLWREQILCSTRERDMLEDFRLFGMYDCFRERYPNKIEFSWWDYRNLGFQKNLGLRIDLIFATEPMMKRLKEISIDRDERKGEKPSDHAPVIAEFL